MTITIFILFFFGVLLAGSDGPYFPLPNFIGLAFISICGLLATKRI